MSSRPECGCCDRGARAEVRRHGRLPANRAVLTCRARSRWLSRRVQLRQDGVLEDRASTPHLPRSNEGAGRTWTRRSSRRTRSWSPSAREDLPQPELLALRQVHEAAVQREWQGVQPPRRRYDRDVPAREVVPGLPDEGRASATTSTSSTSSSPAAATRRRRLEEFIHSPRSSTT